MIDGRFMQNFAKGWKYLPQPQSRISGALGGVQILSDNAVFFTSGATDEVRSICLASTEIKLLECVHHHSRQVGSQV